MLILPNSCFLHVPKTGGTWAKEAIKASGLKYEEYPIEGDPHIGLEYCPVPEKFQFAFVRHPVERYRSYWQYKMGAGWDVNNPLDRDCCSTDFHQFIHNVIKLYPGVCGRDYEQFVGLPGDEIDFIGKFENLIEDLIFALHKAREEFNEENIRSIPPKNVSDKIRFPAKYTSELKDAVRKVEYYTLLRFGYE